jgi:hypothetical protein
LNNLPEIVSAEKWKQECDQLLIAEKEATRLLDGLAARRRRLPMVAFDNARYVFATPEGPRTLLDLFDGRPQLAIYQFMDNGPDEFCPGCTHFTNNVVDLSELADNDVSWATVSNMPLEQIETYKAKWVGLCLSSHHMARPSPTTAMPAAASCSACSSVTVRMSIGPMPPPPVGWIGSYSSTTFSISPSMGARRTGRIPHLAGRSIPLMARTKPVLRGERDR